MPLTSAQEAYRALLARWLLAASDALEREAVLLEVDGLAQGLLSQQVTLDEVLGVHQLAQAALAAQWAGAEEGSPEALGHQQLATGEALHPMMALLLHQQRQAALAEQALREGDKHRAVATLAAGIAHDFNNLLGSIVGLTELCALDAPPQSRQARNLASVRLAADRATELVSQLLHFAREQPRQSVPLELAALLTRCRPLLEAALPRDLVLSVELQQDSVVQADATQLEQVLLNLVRNAGQSQQGHGGVVRLVLDRASLGKGVQAARIRVIDRGPGIDPAVMPRLFEPFFTTKAVGEGTGLGLAASLGIVREHGGQIHAHSGGPGGQTVFTVRLPRLP